MTHEDRAALIESRIIQALQPSYLEVIDESSQHQGHAGYQGGGRHFAVIIQAGCLSQLARVEAHRRIYNLFTDMIPEKIHALRIEIKKIT